MSSINKAIIVGRLGKDPEIRHTQQGSAIATLSVATSETWRDKAGEKKEKTEWHRVVIFNEKMSELAEKYLKKGALVYLEGKLATRKWTDKDGNDKYTTEIVLGAYDGVMRFLSKANDNQSDEERPPSERPKAKAAAKPAESAAADELVDDDVPF